MDAIPVDNGPVYSIVIPVYNSDASLPELRRRIDEVFSSEIHSSYEIIFVDDASPNPETWPALEAVRAEDNRVKIVQLMKNASQQNALMCGFRQVSGSLIVTMDDDLQHPPEEIPKLIEAMGAPPRYDAILAVSRYREHATYRNIGSYLLNKILGVAIKKPKHITLSPFRLMTRDLVDALSNYNGHIVTIGSLICQTTSSLFNVEVRHDARVHGRSTYTPWKLVKLAIANIFNHSDLPLKIISVIGIVTSFAALLYAAWILVGKLSGRPILEGFPTLAILVSFLSGLILFSLGVIGQYIMRILRSVTGGKQYTIRRKLE